MSPTGNILNFPDRSPVEEEAARWVVRVDAGDLSESERSAFEAWKAVPAHSEAYQRLRAHWTDLDGLADLHRKPAGPPAVLRWGGLGLAAAVIIAVAAVGLWPRTPSPATPATVQQASAPAVAVYETALGGQQRIPLADGSVITLNTASQVEVRMTPAERSVRLLTGEAFFEVAHDTSRPFRVYAGDGVTQAVGTAFSVRLEKNGVEVVVSEGRVAYSRVADRIDDAVAYVAAGEAATFGDKVKLIETVDAAEVDRKLSWRQGRLVFAGEPLSSVVADIARYTDIQFEFASPELASMPIGAYFEVGEVDRMLEALQTTLGLKVERIDATHVRILAAKP
jgi:transmembrane sensor